MLVRLFCACIIAILFLSLCPHTVTAQESPMHYTVTMKNPAAHIFHVELVYKNLKPGVITLKIPAWSPGYYQLLHYARNVQNFQPRTTGGDSLAWNKKNDNSWTISNGNNKVVNVSYDVKASTQFVAQSYLDEERGYLIPASLFLYPEANIKTPVKITVVPAAGWKDVATGLDSIAGKQPTFFAPDFDVLYDAPILTGNLEYLPYFKVKGINHRFIGYKLGQFDRAAFVSDLQKIVSSSADIIGDIPYKHYTFLAIGPGRGGIEHLNSTTISFDGSQLNDPAARVRILSFIAHEYFHHYNVKRIRPVELGPFDYDKGNRTNSLWVSEGLTVYYEYLVLVRKGLMSDAEFWKAIRGNMMNYENKPGRLFQSVAAASYNTWGDGPFGRTGDEVNKTISYYDKGPVLGLMLDLKIRHETRNKHSLDDLMRKLYYKYYKEQQRGFTETELKAECEAIAGVPLTQFFEYVYTTKPVDYPTFFNYAGLKIDTIPKPVPGAWLGINTRQRNDSVFINSVDWESPAWNAGLRAGDRITMLEGAVATKKLLDDLAAGKKEGESISIRYIHNNAEFSKDVILRTKMEKDFPVSRIENPDALQTDILQEWLKIKTD